MASSLEFVEYAAGQLAGAGEIDLEANVWRIWPLLRRKDICVVCDDQLYIKITEAGRRLMPELETAPPYEGAKDYFLF